MAHTLMTCPSCSSALPAAARHCPLCGHGVAARADQDCAEKLIAAVLRPLVDIRMTAVVAPGWRHESHAAFALRDLAFRHPVDVVESLALVESLAQIPRGASRAALVNLPDHHPARPIRRATSRELQRQRDGADDSD